MIAWKAVIGKRLIGFLRYKFGRLCQAHGFKLGNNLGDLRLDCSAILLRMDGFEHAGDLIDFDVRHMTEDVAIEVNDATLPLRLGKVFRKTVYRSIEELQADLDAWIKEYNEERPHQGRWCFGKIPMQTFKDSRNLAKEKLIAA